MKRGAILLLSIFASQLLEAAPLERSVSPSQQFNIYGMNATLRGEVSELAEQTKSNLLRLLRQSDRWQTPIVINLQPQQANLPDVPRAELRFSQTGSGLKLQLDLTVAQDSDASLMERELLRAILLEMMYRKQPDLAPGTVLVQPPDWLLDGVLALTAGRDRDVLVEALSIAGNPVQLQDFIQQRPGLLDSMSRLLYRAYSFALVQLLIDQPDGHARLSRYIDNLSNASNDALADLKTEFPVLAGDTEKTWRATVARVNGTQNDQLLAFSDSERRLDDLLDIQVAGTGKPLNLGELARRKPSAIEKAALNQLSVALLLFTGQVNPVLRPIAREYQQIAARLVRGKRGGAAKRLAGIQATREKLAVRMSDIDDYMNWFEATQMETGSGNFNDYLKAAADSQESAPRRRDPLSVYLDSLADESEE